MKISEILTENIWNETDPKIYNALETILFYTEHGIDHGVQEAYTLLMKHKPETMYTGKMYRAIELKPKELTVPDIRMLTAKLQRWSMKHSREVVSWSQLAKSAVNHGTIFDFGLILEQDSTGLDVEKLNATTFTSEKEVLSPYSNTVSVYGFMANEKFYSIDKFDRFMKYVTAHKPIF